MKILKNLSQGSDEWLELRRSKIGASDISYIMDGTKEEVYELWKNKISGERKYVTQAMQRGSMMEGEARFWFNREKIYSFEPIVAIHEEHDWLMASFDGWDSDIGTSIEIKCPVEVENIIASHRSYKKWWWQVQCQLAVGGHKNAILLAYSPSLKVWEGVDRDEDAIANLMAKGKEFHDCVINYDPPERELPQKNDPLTKDAVMAWNGAVAVRKAAEDQEKKSRDLLIDMAGESGFECDSVRVRKIPKQGSIDYKSIPELKEVDLSLYRKKSSEYWRID